MFHGQFSAMYILWLSQQKEELESKVKTDPLYVQIRTALADLVQHNSTDKRQYEANLC